MNENLNPQGYRYGMEPHNINPFWGNGGGGGVTGVKGEVESTYRQGQVNLSLSDITDLGDGLEYNPVTKELSVKALTTQEVNQITALL